MGCLSPLPDAAIEAVRAWLAEKTLVVAGERLEVTGSRPHGHVAAVHAQAKALRRPEIGLHVPVELAIVLRTPGSVPMRPVTVPNRGRTKAGGDRARSVATRVRVLAVSPRPFWRLRLCRLA